VELLEFLIIIFINIFLIVISLWRRGALFGLFGIFINFVAIPMILSSGLVIAKATFYNNATEEFITKNYYGSTNLAVAILIFLTLINALLVIRSVGSES